MERREQPVARTVAGEDATGAVASVSRRREADDEHARLGIAVPGDRTSPVLVVAVGSPLRPGDGLAPVDEARASAALADLGGEAGERPGGVPLAFYCLSHRLRRSSWR